MDTPQIDPKSSRHVTAPDRLPRHLCEDPSALLPVVKAFPMRITPYLLGRMRTPEDALARQFLPDTRELLSSSTDSDPLCEERQSPVPLIIHRYPRRVIFLVTDQCAAYCRFCMRKRRVASQRHWASGARQAAIAYIADHQEINEVILSGGDPLMLSDDELRAILTALRSIPHIRVLRVHTRIPCVAPARITADLARLLTAFHPLFVNVHCNHPDEITSEVARACALLADAGIAIGSQTVLLNGVNDCGEVLRRLMETLLTIRVRPYYLHQIDGVPGTAHFQVPLERGLELAGSLRGRISGLAVPHFMIDLPGGGGKVELVPESIVEKNADHYLVRNFQGQCFRYPVAGRQGNEFQSICMS